MLIPGDPNVPLGINRLKRHSADSSKFEIMYSKFISIILVLCYSFFRNKITFFHDLDLKIGLLPEGDIFSIQRLVASQPDPKFIWYVHKMEREGTQSVPWKAWQAPGPCFVKEVTISQDCYYSAGSITPVHSSDERIGEVPVPPNSYTAISGMYIDFYNIFCM